MPRQFARCQGETQHCSCHLSTQMGCSSLSGIKSYVHTLFLKCFSHSAGGRSYHGRERLVPTHSSRHEENSELVGTQVEIRAEITLEELVHTAETS